MKKLIFVFLLFVIQTPVIAQATFQEWYRLSVQAYEAKDYIQFLKAAKEADELRPNHRVLAYNLAAAYALNNEEQKAIETLSKRIAYYAVDDFSKDDDFESIKSHSSFQQLLEQINEHSRSYRSSKDVFSITKEGFHPEGLAIDQQNQRIFLSDIRTGRIYSYDMNGKNEALELNLKAYGYWSAMGMNFDKNNPSLLWIATSAMNVFEGYNSELQGKSAIVSYDISKKKMVHEFTLAGNHTFGDIILDSKGFIWTTDSSTPAIYKIDPSMQKMTKEYEFDGWWSLNGLTFSENERKIYVADYITGIFIIDTDEGSIVPLSQNMESTRGTDGLYRVGSTIIMLQNGTEPMRVSTFDIDDDGNMKRGSWRVRDNNLKDLNEPTLGTVIDRSLYYIASSPWRFYNGVEQNLEEWPTLNVWKLDIDKD